MKHPEMCYSRDLNNNCIIIKWGEPGYYKTDYPEGGYTDELINDMNLNGDITPAERDAMEICSMVAQDNPNLNWEEHYEMCMNIAAKHRRK